MGVSAIRRLLCIFVLVLVVGPIAGDLGWHTETVDTPGRIGQHNSLAFAPDGRPAISYYYESERDLRYA